MIGRDGCAPARPVGQHLELSILSAALTLAAFALVSLLTAAVALTWLVTRAFISLGLVAVTIAILLILIPLLAALIRLMSLTALTMSAICVWQCLLPMLASCQG